MGWHVLSRKNEETLLSEFALEVLSGLSEGDTVSAIDLAAPPAEAGA